MDGLRIAPGQGVPALLPCIQCAAADRLWDRIAGKPLCPDCQESLVLGLTAPFAERTERRSCAVCHRIGTLCYRTFPLHALTPVEIDLCAEHLRALLARRLAPYAFQQLRRRLQSLGLGVESIFLLHDAFYDEKGCFLQPAEESD